MAKCPNCGTEFTEAPASSSTKWRASGGGRKLAATAILAIVGIFVALYLSGTIPPLLGTANRTDGLSPSQQAVASDAIKSLGKLSAAVEVGVTFSIYTQLVVEAKASVNEATRILPHGELSSRINDAMIAYSDSATVWNSKIQDSRHGLRREFGDGELIDRYKLQLKLKPNGLFPEVDKDRAMQEIWASAGRALAAARALLELSAHSGPKRQKWTHR